ncbi:MAG: CPBP family intramembrane metalloprotease [Pirellulales bacterium]|nr:CPBP family intramembrane metalloprotease [Pirellulales bacterium]
MSIMSLSSTKTAPSLENRIIPLVVLTVLPLGAIGLQLALGLQGVLGYSLYKAFFLVPPLIYCWMTGVRPVGDILKPRNWRRALPAAVGLGVLAIAIFWGAYFALGDLLLDKVAIARKIGEQFSVTAATVLLVAPVTIFANSLLEEFFYRGFAFGRLVGKNRRLAYWLPAAAFTLQHMLFIHDWATPSTLVLAVVGLMVFALVTQKLYESADSIVAPWAAHILGDVAMMGIALEILW